MDLQEQYKGRILIVDDSADLLEMLDFILRINHYEVFAKNNAVDVYDFVLNNNIDLLLLDVNTWSIKGRKICKKLKADPETAYFPVILMSSDPNLLYDFRECNADGVMDKPFELDVLLSKINACINTVY